MAENEEAPSILRKEKLGAVTFFFVPPERKEIMEYNTFSPQED